AGFADWVLQDLATARAELDRLARNEGDLQSVKTIFRVVHDLKGQGGTFGYALITAIAAPLCDFLRDAKTVPSGVQLDVIKAHLMALAVVIRKDIKGDGDEVARELVQTLTLAAARVPVLG